MTWLQILNCVLPFPSCYLCWYLGKKRGFMEGLTKGTRMRVEGILSDSVTFAHWVVSRHPDECCPQCVLMNYQKDYDQANIASEIDEMEIPK